jgi:hypothetical protein
MWKRHRIMGLLGVVGCLMIAVAGAMMLERLAAVVLVLTVWVLISFPLAIFFGHCVLEDGGERPDDITPDDITSVPHWRRPQATASLVSRDAVEPDFQRMEGRIG